MIKMLVVFGLAVLALAGAPQSAVAAPGEQPKSFLPTSVYQFPRVKFYFKTQPKGSVVHFTLEAKPLSPELRKAVAESARLSKQKPKIPGELPDDIRLVFSVNDQHGFKVWGMGVTLHSMEPVYDDAGRVAGLIYRGNSVDSITDVTYQQFHSWSLRLPE